MIRKILFAACLCLFASLLNANENPFRVEILDYPKVLPLGLGRDVIAAEGVLQGWIQTEIRVRVSYVGTDVLPIVFWPFDGYEVTGFSAWAVVRDRDGREERRCTCPAALDTVYTGIDELNPGWTKDYTIPVCLPGVGTYTVSAEAGNSKASLTTISGERFELWTGTSSSQPVLISVEDPVGVDKEAFEAFDGHPLDPPQGYGELLRRFPTSTYAAYLVWGLYAKGTSFVDPRYEADSIQRGPIDESGSGFCDLEGQIDLTRSWRFSGRRYVFCRDNWMNYVSGHYPDIWFADEIRLKLALDAYLLGDKASCGAGLEALSEHAKPYVAEKAQALLEAMQAKGMLPGGENDSPAPQAESATTGNATK